MTALKEAFFGLSRVSAAAGDMYIWSVVDVCFRCSIIFPKGAVSAGRSV